MVPGSFSEVWEKLKSQQIFCGHGMQAHDVSRHNSVLMCWSCASGLALALEIMQV